MVNRLARPTLISVLARRRSPGFWWAAATVWILAGCSAVSPGPVPAVETAGLAAASSVVRLVPTLAVRGGRAPVTGARSAPLEWVPLVRPVAATVVAGAVHVVEGAPTRLVRYDPVEDRLTVVADLPPLDVGGRVGMDVGPDLSVYVADPVERRVLQFAVSGQVLRALADDRHLEVPVDVAVDAAGGLFVADALNDRVLVFNPQGRPVRVIEPDPRFFERVCCLAAAPGVLFIADAARPRVARIDLRTGSRAVLSLDGRGALADIAATDGGLLFVLESGTGELFVFDPAGRALTVVRPRGEGTITADAIAVGDGRLVTVAREAARVDLHAIEWPATAEPPR